MNSIALTRCLVCHSKKNYYDFSLDQYRVEECANCGMMRLNPQPSDEALGQIYGANYFFTDTENIAALKSSTADRYLDLLTTYTKAPLQGKLLEVGCGHGDFLARAKARGLDVTGVEYSEHSVAIAQAKLGTGGTVIQGEIAAIDTEARFDYIVFADVLEHVRNPRLFLQKAHALLNENGIAVAIVPSTDSLSARLMRNKWMEFKPEHLWYFSRKNLRQLLYTEHFGSTKTHKAKKTLSFNYIAEHFNRYPVQPFTSLLNLGKKILPNFIGRQPLHLDAGGIMVIARKKPVTTRKKLSIVMAVYNEEKTLSLTVDRVLAKTLPDLDIELIIVESQSTDNTQTILKQYESHPRVTVIYQPKAMGKGYAIREGFKHVTGDFILIQDADDEYDFEDYDALLEPLVSGEQTFVLGARHGGRAWKMRQFSDQRLTGHFLNFGHWGFTLLVNVLFGLRLKDPFTMFKVFRTDCLDGLQFECNRFDFDYELLIKLVRSGNRPIEIPVNYRSRSFKEGKKIRVFRDPITWIRAIVRFRLQKAN